VIGRAGVLDEESFCTARTESLGEPEDADGTLSCHSRS
jgi:hypothetical protein